MKVKGRTLAMGDIHGNLTAYHQCMRRCRFENSFDTLIQLGDVSDRHPYTAEVVEELLKIKSLVAIRGNHDHWTRKWLLHGAIDRSWLENGGFVTIKSYERLNCAIDKEAHQSFFDSKQVDYFIDVENRLFVHGGFVHPKGPEFEVDSSLCYRDRSLLQNAFSVSTKPEILANFTEIYLGHTPTLNWFQSEPMHIHNLWNLDTGAGTTGKLTIMDIDTKEYWQSD